MKNKDKKKDMPEVTFKQFTPDEDRIYEEAVAKYREVIGAGKKLHEAYAAYAIADPELGAIIQADFLKILIAERHFAKRETFEQLAADLGITVTLIKDTYARMLQEVGITAANHFSETSRPVGSDELKTND